MLQTLRNIFQSNIKSLEILYVIEDVKPTARIMVNEDETDKVFNFFKEKELNYAISDFKVVKQDKDKVYSDKGVKVSIDSSEKGYFFVYVSKDIEKANAAKKSENENKHKELGILLGYPECCAEFFEEHFEEESRKQNDFTLATLKNSEGFEFPYYTNIASRHFDLTLLNHFPCNFNCKHSIELAKRNLEVIRKHDEETVKIIEGMLKGAVLYTGNGVYLLRQPFLEHNKLFYKGVMGSKNKQLYESLKNAEYVEIVKNNRIILDGLMMKNVGIMLFS